MVNWSMPQSAVYVYRLFDASDRLLYIGRSVHPETHIKTHRRCSTGWRLDIARWELEKFSSASAALTGQRRATWRERPLHPDPTCSIRAKAQAPKPPARSRFFHIYRLFDAYDQLLYIGRAREVDERIASHRAVTAGWQSLIDHWSTEPFATASDAIRAQRKATIAERPLHADVTCDVVIRPAWVYRLFDTDGVLQYIGQTGNLQQRILAHIQKERFPIVDWTAEEFSSRAIAIKAEKEAIATERPLHNKVITIGGEVRSSTTYEAKVALADRLLGQVARSEITHRAAVEDLMLAGYDMWRAVDLLGLKNGWPSARRKYKTLDSLMALNGLE
jgi:predicted GIY-YIG superfamily endonuclease